MHRSAKPARGSQRRVRIDGDREAKRYAEGALSRVSLRVRADSHDEPNCYFPWILGSPALSMAHGRRMYLPSLSERPWYRIFGASCCFRSSCWEPPKEAP